MTSIAACLPLALALLAQPSLEVHDAWVRQTSATRTISSGYMRIENHSAAPVSLIRVAVDGARNAEVHAMVEDNGRTIMKPLARLPVPAHGSVTLAPGGTHLMVTDVTRPFQVGSHVRLTLTFDNHQIRTVQAIVRPLDAVSAK
jgi:copper(I)-binding protein